MTRYRVDIAIRNAPTVQHIIWAKDLYEAEAKAKAAHPGGVVIGVQETVWQGKGTKGQ